MRQQKITLKYFQVGQHPAFSLFERGFWIEYKHPFILYTAPYWETIRSALEVNKYTTFDFQKKVPN